MKCWRWAMPQFQKKCLGKMEEVGRGGPDGAVREPQHGGDPSLCSRSLWIDQGKIRRDGPSQTVVSSYLNQEQTKAGQRIWTKDERPGNKSFRLASINLKTTSGEITSDINISEELLIEIDYEVIRPGARVIFSLHLMDENDGHICSSLSNQAENEYHDVPLSPGYYRSICRLPGNLLNSCRYTISLKGLSDGWSDSFLVERALAFEGLDRTGD